MQSHDERDTPTIAVGYSRLLARQLNMYEKDLPQLLRGSGLSSSALMDDRTLLSKSQQLQIVANALAYSGDPAFGLRVGQLLTPATHGPLGFLANNSPNLITAIKDFLRFIPARINIFHCYAQFDGNDLNCCFQLSFDGMPKLQRLMSECFVLALIKLIEFVLGRPFSEGSVEFTHSQPAYYSDYQAAIACPIGFDAPTYTVRVPEQLLYTANVSAHHEHYVFALNQCQKMLAHIGDGGQSMSERVERLLLSHPPRLVDEAQAAELNFVSRRTLARRLSAEGQTFRAIQDKLLMALATDYLSQTTLSVEAIASLLNYHDSSCFRRAFKRWTGLTPQQFRRVTG